jgi:hypothetical protein
MQLQGIIAVHTIEHSYSFPYRVWVLMTCSFCRRTRFCRNGLRAQYSLQARDRSGPHGAARSRTEPLTPTHKRLASGFYLRESLISGGFSSDVNPPEADWKSSTCIHFACIVGNTFYIGLNEFVIIFTFSCQAISYEIMTPHRMTTQLKRNPEPQPICSRGFVLQILQILQRSHLDPPSQWMCGCKSRYPPLRVNQWLTNVDGKDTGFPA